MSDGEEKEAELKNFAAEKLTTTGDEEKATKAREEVFKIFNDNDINNGETTGEDMIFIAPILREFESLDDESLTNKATEFIQKVSERIKNIANPEIKGDAMEKLKDESKEVIENIKDQEKLAELNGKSQGGVAVDTENFKDIFKRDNYSINNKKAAESKGKTKEEISAAKEKIKDKTAKGRTSKDKSAEDNAGTSAAEVKSKCMYKNVNEDIKDDINKKELSELKDETNDDTATATQRLKNTYNIVKDRINIEKEKAKNAFSAAAERMKEASKRNQEKIEESESKAKAGISAANQKAKTTISKTSEHMKEEVEKENKKMAEMKEKSHERMHSHAKSKERKDSDEKSNERKDSDAKNINNMYKGINDSINSIINGEDEDGEE